MKRLLGKVITVRSASGNPNDTIIDGTGHFHVVQCVSGEGPATVLEGFTITGGNANGLNFSDSMGGGMINISSSPTVRHCVFIGNTAANDGGGMGNESSSPLVSHCIFRGNSATNGGGLDDFNASSSTVRHCVFLDNTASISGGGVSSNAGMPIGSDQLSVQRQRGELWRRYARR